MLGLGYDGELQLRDRISKQGGDIGTAAKPCRRTVERIDQPLSSTGHWATTLRNTGDPFNPFASYRKTRLSMSRVTRAAPPTKIAMAKTAGRSTRVIGCRVAASRSSI